MHFPTPHLLKPRTVPSKPSYHILLPDAYTPHIHHAASAAVAAVPAAAAVAAAAAAATAVHICIRLRSGLLHMGFACIVLTRLGFRV